MKSLNFKKIDAFTGNGSTGNPAGYIRLDSPDQLTESEMQQIAAELKGFVNEVGYVNSEGRGYYLRYFSSECEVAFCGHATIAILYDLLKNNGLSHTEHEVNIRVKAGELTVYNCLADEDAVFITAPAPQYLDCQVDLSDLAEALSIKPMDIQEGLPVRLIDSGLRTLLVPITSLDAVLFMHPDQEKLRQFCLRNSVDIVHIFTSETSYPENRYRTRVFAPKFGYLEDPATGSGNSAFGYYLLAQNLWPRDINLEQGPDRNSPNIIKLKQMGKKGEKHILFGGRATTRIEGIYLLQS
jgi:PhzF family phenazine biosynthesis protein